MTVVVVAIFFVMWYMRFPARLAEGTLELGAYHFLYNVIFHIKLNRLRTEDVDVSVVAVGWLASRPLPR